MVSWHSSREVGRATHGASGFLVPSSRIPLAGNAAQRAELGAALRTRGLKVSPSQTNFLLVEFGADASRIEAALVSRGVVLRPMVGYGLGECLRITVGTEDENRRLLDALDGFFA